MIGRGRAVPPASPGSPTESPREQYNHRLGRRREESLRLARRERLVGNGKLVVFLVGAAIAWLAFAQHLISAWWLIAPVSVFVNLLFRHERVTHEWYRAGRAVAFYKWALTRLDGEWRGKGRPGTRFLDETHPYAADLDLFGSGSLFELLCTARTRTGEETLASWLRGTAGAEEIAARQAAVAELRPLLDLREELALLGDDVPIGIDFDAVSEWGAEPTILHKQWPRWLALGIGLTSIIGLLGWLLNTFGTPFLPWIFEFSLAGPFLISATAGLILAGWFRSRVIRILMVVQKRSRDLSLLANVLACLERPTFHTPRLQQLQAQLAETGKGGRGIPPSQQIAELGNLLDLLNSRRNQLFAPFAALLLWGTQMAFAIELWRARSGRHIRTWLAVVGQFEALCALATYAYENPEDPFPEIVTDAVCYDGEGLAHPLLPLPRERRIRNDFKVGAELHLLVVSGSNMSGKSTYLRTIGINAVLALAGAPVMARRMRLCPLVLGATLRIQDSLQEGRSRFFAEILRVRQVVELSRGSLPLLFLLDEIFAGTNSHDRRLGAEAVVRGLVKAGAIGLITTHDLSLTHIAEQLGSSAVNVHFADQFIDGEMIFDYRLQPGVVRNSNALALMRAVGLEV
jgi:MutS domain V